MYHVKHSEKEGKSVKGVKKNRELLFFFTPFCTVAGKPILLTGVLITHFKQHPLTTALKKRKVE